MTAFATKTTYAVRSHETTPAGRRLDATTNAVETALRVTTAPSTALFSPSDSRTL